MISQSQRKSEFLGRYRLDDRLLQRGDAKSGRPNMRRGDERETGQPILIKQWRRESSAIDQDIREIWRQELRQLHRVAGYPGARECIVALLDSGEDSENFYLVLAPGQRIPLRVLIDDDSFDHWIKNPKLVSNRQKLWAQLRAIVKGLGILHTQGFLHRNLDSWAIFATASENPEFQLSGFEWSVRLSGVAERSLSRPGGVKGEILIYSFLEDWKALGKLVASLVQVEPKALLARHRYDDATNPAPHLIGEERDLLFCLLQPESLARIDSEVILSRIDAIVGRLTAIAERRESNLFITYNLGSASTLSKAIRDVSDREIEADQVEEQLDFIKGDIADCLLVTYAFKDSPGVTRYSLQGRSLIYRLRPFQTGRKQTEASWALAYVEDVEKQRPVHVSINGQRQVHGSGIEIVPLSDARKRIASIQARAIRWDKLIEQSDASTESALVSRQHRALVLVQLLETLFSVADIWPVKAESVKKADDKYVVNVIPRKDEERERLSEALGLRQPAFRMKEIFASELAGVDEEWRLTEVGVLGERDQERARWKYIGMGRTNDGETTFQFEGPETVPSREFLYLRSGEDVGDDRLLRRRAKALGALRTHTELLETLADPRASVRETHEEIAEDAEFGALDDSKRGALKEAVAIVPLYLLQGPPGVGKTRLVQELVRRRVADDPTTRMLLTAQSHHAVDHLLEEVLGGLPNSDGIEPLVVRCRPKEYSAAADSCDLRERTREIVNDLLASRLASLAPPNVRSKLEALGASFTHVVQEDHGHGVRPDRALEALVLRAANLVFASTNSGDLERLIEEGAQFDWTIVEEAGKATGVELVAPLLLSHRRLMIGDHKQLPPFGAERLSSLLQQPKKVRAALEVGRALIASSFRDAGLEDAVDDGSEEELARVCGEAANALMLFETLVEAELARQERQPSRRPIAKRLSYQHRMHPAIARLISGTFYQHALRSGAECEKRFREQLPPFIVVPPAVLPDSPIVLVDMPYVQSKMGAGEIERKPRYHNPDEVNAVVEVLSHLAAEQDAKPKLAVLTPYREQEKRLRQRIADESSGRLKHLSAFEFEGRSESPVGTVDSFQGSEADVVVLSLVRNNHHSGRHGLGFLADPRRMNVLLSRARWKMVIVVSLEFLRTRIPQSGGLADRELEFLRRMLNTLDQLRKERTSKGVPLASVIPLAQIGERK